MVNFPSTDQEENGTLKTGPAIVGIILNWWLFGILVMQYFMYCTYSASKDKKTHQIVVHLLLALNTVQTIMTMVDAFDWFVYGFGRPDAMLEFGLASVDSPFMDGLIAFIVQMVYCWRVRVLSQRRVMPALIAVFALVGGVNGIFVGIYDRIVRRVTDVKPDFNAPAMLWLWSSVVTDILITSSMSYLLLKLRCYRLTSRTVVATKRIFILSLETNSLTAAMALATAVMFVVKPLAPPRTNIHLVGGYIIGKLYSNCFMVLLNQRIHRENQESEHTGSKDLEEAELSALDVMYSSTTFSSSTATTSKSNAKPAYPKAESTSCGDISTIHFAEPPSIADLRAKRKASDTSASEPRSDLTSDSTHP